MKHIHRLIVISIIAFTFYSIPLFSAVIREMPRTLTQPDGSKLQCFASGDEYHNWFHDAKGFTIIKSQKTGYYVYAEKAGDKLVAGNLIAGQDNPAWNNLQPYINISVDEYKRYRQTKFYMPETRDAPTSGTINNVGIFIRFSDDSEFNQQISDYEGWFNTNTNSQKNYFLEASYNQLTVDTSFYPSSSNSYVVSWQDSYPRSYYQPYNATTNPNGYSGDDQRRSREFTLLANAVAGVQSSIPQSLVIDSDNDGRVDNIVFTIKGSSDDWGELLWPHRWAIWDRNVYLHGKRVYDFNFQLQDFLDFSSVGVLCHEFFHTLGAPDLYHYTENGINPVGAWDIMESTQNPPQHMGAYMKYKYGDWIPAIPTISADGQYTLNPLTSSTGNCFRINSPNTASEYFVVEYRKQIGTFESSVPGSGLLVYRINPAYDGNADGPPDEVYIYRPNGTETQDGSINLAHFSSNVGRVEINSTTNPSPFLSNGNPGGLELSSIGSAGTTLSFIKGQGLAVISSTPGQINENIPSNSSISQNITIGNNGNVALNYTLSKPVNEAIVLAEGFETASIPSAWSEYLVSGTNTAWEVTSGGYNGHPDSAFEGSYNAKFYRGSTAASVSKLITPQMNLSAAETASLSFYHTQAVWYGDQDELRIYYRTSSAASWNLLETYTQSIEAWTQRIINLPNLTSGYQIAFEATGQYGYGVCLDQIEITKEVAGDFTWIEINGGDSFSGLINPGASSQIVNVSLSSLGLSPGNYTTDITITSNAVNNPLITIPVVMSVFIPTPPQVSIEGTEGNINLNWDALPYAEWYAIYAADTPTNDYFFVGTVVGSTEISLPPNAEMKFFKITGGQGEIPNQ